MRADRASSLGTQVVAVDWSGKAKGESEFIWLARVRDSHLVDLENGRSRDATVNRVIELANRDERTVIGLDFAFSFPVWYLDKRGWTGGRDVWDAMRDQSDSLLKECSDPFWGRPSRPCVHGQEPLRQTEKEADGRAKSVFQIGGAGAVGTGSIRGMPCLATLQNAGFNIWPFDLDGWPRVIEIYPRLLTQAVTKGRHIERLKYMNGRFPHQPEAMRERAAGSEDAFDAAVSALVMAEHVHELENLSQAPPDGIHRREGQIWSV